MPPNSILGINLRDARKNPLDRRWELPAWGHPLSMMVMPLFILVGGRMKPVGTAFAVGGGIGFIMSATHNMVEAISADGTYDTEIASGVLPEKLSLRHVNLAVLHHHVTDDGRLRGNFLMLKSVEGAPPTDVVVGHTMLPPGIPSLSLPVSFAVPSSGDTVWSVGYCDFEYPEGGIPIEDVRDGNFDWGTGYKHRFVVVEGKVEAAFSPRLCSYLNGPCFVFDENIPHGLSGGPVITEDGRIIGVNSAGAEMFFNRPMTAATMLYPLALTRVRFGASLGPLTFNSIERFIDLVMRGAIKSDGTESRIVFTVEDDGATSITVGVPIGTVTVYEDLNGYASGTPATKLEGAFYVFRPRQADGDTD